jgi:hypothetical protein
LTSRGAAPLYYAHSTVTFTMKNVLSNVSFCPKFERDRLAWRLGTVIIAHL